MTAPLFQLSNQSLGYGAQTVLQNLSLSIAAGEKLDQLDRLIAEHCRS